MYMKRRDRANCGIATSYAYTNKKKDEMNETWLEQREHHGIDWKASREDGLAMKHKTHHSIDCRVL